MSETRLNFLSGSLSLEGVLHIPQGKGPALSQSKGPFAGVAICHPHPRYGGDMHNNVVMAAVNGLLSHGIAALRFNFRGVGRSQGEYSGGDGERQDAAAALRALAQRPEIRQERLGLAGYSFGAGVALAVAGMTPDVKAVAAIACPTPALEEFTRATFAGPKLFLTGNMDSFIPEEVVRGLVDRLPRSIGALHVLRGADHFLLGHEAEIGRLVGEFFRDHLR